MTDRAVQHDGASAPAMVENLAGLSRALGVREDRLRSAVSAFGASAPGGADGPWDPVAFGDWLGGVAFTKAQLAAGLGRNPSNVSRAVGRHGDGFPGGAGGPWLIDRVRVWWARELKEPNVETRADRDGAGLTTRDVASIQAGGGGERPASSSSPAAAVDGGAAVEPGVEDPDEALRAERDRRYTEEKRELDLEARREQLRKAKRENDIKAGELVPLSVVRRALEGRAHALQRAASERIDRMRAEFVGLRTPQEAAERLAELVASVLAEAVTTDPASLVGDEQGVGRAAAATGQGVAA